MDIDGTREIRDSSYFQRTCRIPWLIGCNVFSTPVKEVIVDDMLKTLLSIPWAQQWHLGSVHVFYFISSQVLNVASSFQKSIWI